MNTAQGGIVSSLLYVVVLVVCLRTVYRASGGPVPRPVHPAAVVLWLVVAVPSVIGLVWPPLFAALSRQPSLIEQGQVWRLLTSVVVQDGGIVGTVFNLVILALTVPAAVRLWGPAPAVGVFVLGTVLFNLPSTFLWNAAGGGNSGATFFLVTATLGMLLASHARPGARTAALVAAVGGIVLLVLGDAHGEAVLAGLAVGLAVGVFRAHRGAPA